MPSQSLPVSKPESKKATRHQTTMADADRDAKTNKVRETTRQESLGKQRKAMRPR
jgi:hypothetical protein